MASVKGNIILNGINTVTGLLFPMVTFPYAARVLMPDGIGTVNFLNSIISYIVLLTGLGIPVYAVREVARYRDDPARRDKIAVEIICLSFFLCLLGYVGVWALAQFVPQIHQDTALFYVLSLSIVFTSLGVNWFYQGIEDFMFITVRATIIRILAAAALFVFVKDEDDLLNYGLILVGSTVGNNLINFVHLRKHIRISMVSIKELEVMRHLKPSLQVFILSLIISLYIYMNSIMLGFISGDAEVGYFTAGTKISHIGLTLIGSLGTVLLPRCSNLVNKGDKSGFKSIINKSLNVTLAVSLPMTAGLIILAHPVTMVFCGPEYLESIPVLIINAPVIIFVSLASITSTQVLYPMDKIKIVLISVSGGLVINILMNFLLIPRYGAVGAALSATAAELTVLMLQLGFGRKYYPFKISDLVAYRYIVSTFIMSVVVYFTVRMLYSDLLQIVIGGCIGVGSYFLLLLGMKDPIICALVNNLKKKISCI